MKVRPNFSHTIIDLYGLAESLECATMSFKIKMMANALAKLGNEYQEKFESSVGAPENKKLEKRV